MTRHSNGRGARLAIVALAMTAAWTLGCGGGGFGVDRRDAGDDNDFDWGSFYNTSDEQPGFGDEEILAMVADTPYDDPYDDMAMPSTAGDVYYVRVMWGNLVLDSDVESAVDYSGTIAIDDGLIVIERTILFDNWDTEIDTREDPTYVAWSSHTRPHFDGLLLRVEPGVSADADNSLRLIIGPYVRDIALADLASLVSLEPSGAGDDQVAIAAYRQTEAEAGFVDGRWRDLVEREGGVAKAKWETGPGELLGHLRCRYLPESETGGVVRGKAIDADGNFEAMLEGAYEATDGAFQDGAFAIDWIERDGETTGAVEGVYYKPEDAVGRGFLLGLWSRE